MTAKSEVGTKAKDNPQPKPKTKRTRQTEPKGKRYYVIINTEVCTHCHGWDGVVRKVFLTRELAQNWINHIDHNRYFYIEMIEMNSYHIYPVCTEKRECQEVLLK